MIDLTPEERQHIEKEATGQSATLTPNDRARAIEQAKKGVDAVSQGLQEAIRRKELDHSIRLKHFRHYAKSNWFLLSLANTLKLHARLNEPRVETIDEVPVTTYLTELLMENWLLKPNTEAEKELKRAFLLEGISLLPSFFVEDFFWNNSYQASAVYADSPATSSASGAGKWLLANEGSQTPWGLEIGTQCSGYYLLESGGGKWFALVGTEPASGAWTYSPQGSGSYSFTIHSASGNLSGSLSNGTWTIPGASGTFQSEAGAYSTIADEAIAQSYGLVGKIEEWLDRLVNPSTGSTGILKSVQSNLQGGVSSPPPYEA